ncbi:MAG: ABC transporter ATP-binding protein [Alphaproteobacteria bacterium]
MPSIKLTDVGMDFRISHVSQNRLLHPEFFREFLGGKLGITARNQLIISALDGISIDINEGTRLGILGHNGSGKSTLLRVMANIYAPTRGSVTTDGIISTLFSISLGLDEDLTGRDNIRLQGLVFGMTANEIEDALPDIEEFTQLSDFLSLPIRTYSSGMRARLSFAVATALKPDILLLDEVIGAGDAAFMNKANERLEQMLEDANILVIASHSNDIIRKFCNQAIVLEKGNLVHFGAVEESIEVYAKRVAEVSSH